MVRTTLAPLSEGEVRDLIAHIAWSELTEAQRSAIVTRADGNALFVEESVAAGRAGVPGDLADLLLVRRSLRARPAEGNLAGTLALAAIGGQMPQAASGDRPGLAGDARRNFEEVVRAVAHQGYGDVSLMARSRAT